MNNTFRLATPMALLAAVVALPASAAAPQRSQYAVRGVNASLSIFMSDQCSYQNVFVSGGESAIKATGTGAVDTSYLNVSVSGFNWCTFTETYGFLEGKAVLTGNIHNKLRIVGQVSGFLSTNWVQQTVTGEIDLTLTPLEHPILTHSEGTWATSGVFQRMRSVGLRAEASVSGSVVVAGTDHLAAAIASGAFVQGYVNTTNSGSMEIYR